jgi:hypothetical protein
MAPMPPRDLPAHRSPAFFWEVPAFLEYVQPPTLDGAWWRPKNADPEAWAPDGAALLIPFDGDGHWDMCFDYGSVGPE